MIKIYKCSGCNNIFDHREVCYSCLYDENGNLVQTPPEMTLVVEKTNKEIIDLVDSRPKFFINEIGFIKAKMIQHEKQASEEKSLTSLSWMVMWFKIGKLALPKEEYEELINPAIEEQMGEYQP